VADFAGHYVLTTGLDDPSGLDVHSFASMPPMTNMSAPSASFDIDGAGTVVSGVYQVAGDAAGCHYTFVGDTADGYVGAVGIGQIFFHGTTTEDGGPCKPLSYPGDRFFQLGIEGTTVHLCRSNMASTATCAEPYTRKVATFDRIG
jgi:hypothetical protein